MTKSSNWIAVVGTVCHGLVGAAMLFACGLKALGAAPKQVVDNLTTFGLAEQMRLIGAGGLVAAVLLLFPRTMLLGSLVASAYWGGAISLHMGHHEPYVFPALLILLIWIGAALRDPSVLWRRSAPTTHS
jgi:DoxX-like family